MSPLRRILRSLTDVAVDDSLSDEERTVRRTLTAAWMGVSVVTLPWGLLYLSFDEVVAGLIPIVYCVVTWISFGAFKRFGGWEWIRVSQLLQHLVLPFALMWVLGGFGPSSAVLVWALLAPLSSMWAGRRMEALLITSGMIVLTIFSALIDAQLQGDNNLPEELVTFFYAGNFTVMTVVIVVLVGYFVRQHVTATAIMRRNRELETAYLHQELSLRQAEKLATVGKLSAGLAHELNNPASAVQQATNELSSMLLGTDRIEIDIARLALPVEQEAVLAAFATRIMDRATHPEYIDPIERSDRETEIEAALERLSIADAWELAPSLVRLGIVPHDIDHLQSTIDPSRLGEAMHLLDAQFKRQALLSSLDESTSRIIGMVQALKTYTHLDRSPRQSVDIHEGLDSTLVMFQNRLKSGIEVNRDFAEDLPPIDAYGGELNQVWTNIIDNALDAMGGNGSITLTTRRDGDDVEVAISDTGPGVPSDIIDTVFDPFVTSKGPGEGTGLGLNISHNIVTQIHGGRLTVESIPGSTVFRIRLPIRAAQS